MSGELSSFQSSKPNDNNVLTRIIPIESGGVAHERLRRRFLLFTKHNIYHLQDLVPVSGGELLQLLGQHGSLDPVPVLDLIAQQHICSHIQRIGDIDQDGQSQVLFSSFDRSYVIGTQIDLLGKLVLR